MVWVIKLRRMRWEGHVAHMGERRGKYRVLVGKPEGERPLVRPRHRWEGVWTGTRWLRTGTLMNVVMNLQVP
jgi:hypothetical protein